jgi:hypothetical protein
MIMKGNVKFLLSLTFKSVIFVSNVILISQVKYY